MDISYYGANCVEVTTKQLTLVVDATLSQVGLKDRIVKDTAVYIATHHDFMPGNAPGIRVDGPGEYEIKDISIVGVPAQRMTDHTDAKQATMYRVSVGDVSIAIIGHVAVPLDEEQLEKLGVIDVLVVPVGGNGYTLDNHHAAAVVRQVDPKVVIPTHYADDALRYEVPQMELEPFLKEISAQHEVLPKYKIKNGVLPDTLTVIELTRS